MFNTRQKPKQPHETKRPDPPAPRPRDEAEPNFTPEPLDPTNHPD